MILCKIEILFHVMAIKWQRGMRVFCNSLSQKNVNPNGQHSPVSAWTLFWRLKFIMPQIHLNYFLKHLKTKIPDPWNVKVSGL